MPLYVRPEEAHPVQVKEPVEGVCPECGAEQLRRYPVNSEGGWFVAVKCQSCLRSVERERWRLLGPLQMLSDTI